ncbi:MAG: acyltransferase family protein, partial [Actinomycetes bacterium]
MAPDYFQRTTAGLPRIEPLTGLRWFAVLGVFFSHNVPGGSTPPWVQRLFAGGYMGLPVFFVLSGFVLTVTYGESLSTPTRSAIRNYGVARIARIYPLYLFVLVYVVLISASSSSLPDGWWQHFLAIQAWSPDVRFAYALNSSGWFVGVDMFLYAMFPILIVLFRPLLRTPARGLMLAGGAVLFIAAAWFFFRQTGLADRPPSDPASAHRWLYRMPAMRLGDFGLGIGLAAAFLGLRGRGVS